MGRHDPGEPPSDEPGHAGRRLAAAAATAGLDGLPGGPPLIPGSAGRGGTGDSTGSRGSDDLPVRRTPDDSPGNRGPRLRWRTGLRAATLLCLVAMTLLGWFWWQAANVTAAVSPPGSVNVAASGDGPGPAPDTGLSPTAGSSPGGSGAGATGKIIVHVAGAVVRAGIVELPQGSRLHEAIAAAGGSAPDADPGQLNLAAVLQDGQKVQVPRRGETPPAGSTPAGDSGVPGSATGGTGPTAAAGKINLNTAGADELATLPRVGPVLAQRIVDWRAQHGHFQRVEELDAVDGVGPKLLAALLPLVRV
ncbi:helix-hairpin-helix domain-containing protein [Arthrobacter sp. PsM3]|uniref:helix-hairpin-helix domain-containing protein n=1 Tax=Arthrobacter sp. PsM3 TaxID=3030531 RepID=UPI00263B9CF9|nr:helix-hairpin-helix domain-containing protein [Arthrobacter sp. PsM3]MDN4646455.1 helix-hairpin-helix domain-containing protein [Arthrobacter sp. PsM3]